MIKAEFFLELLTRLLRIVCLDSAGELLERSFGGKIGEIIFALTSRAMLANDPDLLSRGPRTPRRHAGCASHGGIT